MSDYPFWGIGSMFANLQVLGSIPSTHQWEPNFLLLPGFSYTTLKVAIILIPSILRLEKIDPTHQRRQSFTSSHGNFISFAILYIWPYPSKRGITHKLTWWLHFIFGICSGWPHALQALANGLKCFWCIHLPMPSGIRFRVQLGMSWEDQANSYFNP